MLSATELATVKESFLFSGESEEFIKAFAESEHCRLSEFQKGDAVYGKDTRDCLGILLSGKAAAESCDSANASLKLFGKGEVFGAATVFCDGSHPVFCRVTAKGRCRVLYITRQGVTEYLAERPVRALSYITFLSGRVEFLNRRISTFTSREAISRVAKFLLENADENGVCHSVNFSQLAKNLDISRASLYRARAELIEINALSADGHTVTVLDREALKNLL